MLYSIDNSVYDNNIRWAWLSRRRDRLSETKLFILSLSEVIWGGIMWANPECISKNYSMSSAWSAECNIKRTAIPITGDIDGMYSHLSWKVLYEMQHKVAAATLRGRQKIKGYCWSRLLRMAAGVKGLLAWLVLTGLDQRFGRVRSYRLIGGCNLWFDLLVLGGYWAYWDRTKYNFLRNIFGDTTSHRENLNR